MSRRGVAIDRDPAVRTLAEAMGIQQPRGLLREIPKLAVARVEGWIDTCGFNPQSIEELHRLVLSQTQLRIERIETDADLERIGDSYAGDRLAIGRQLLLFEFEEGNTEALVFRRRDARYVAVVDARGDRRYRAWFSSWHEPSHLIVPDAGAKVLSRRTQVVRPEPLEQVIDAVASAVGFWEPIIEPVLVRALRSSRSVIDAFEAVRLKCVPEASRESTYRALARMVSFPLVVLRVAHGCRRGDRSAEEKRKSFALRAQTVISNEFARARKMDVWRNYRIPRESVIAAAVEGGSLEPLVEMDQLENWTDSHGRRLGPCAVRITAQGSWATMEFAG